MEWVLLGMITTLIVVGLYFARSTQDYIDEQNQRYREERKNDRTNMRNTLNYTTRTKLNNMKDKRLNS